MSSELEKIRVGRSRRKLNGPGGFETVALAARVDIVSGDFSCLVKDVHAKCIT